jgi:hydrogenase 3 maturation protease
MSWQNTIKEFTAGNARIAILGIGNIRKGDDAAGALCADTLKVKFGPAISDHIKIVNGGETPENFTGDIRHFSPSHVIIIDAVIAGHQPGAIFIVEPEKIENTDVSTHRMPLTMLYRFLEESIGSHVIMIGIEPEKVDLDTKISKSVQSSIELIVNHLFLLLSPNNI